MIQNYKNNVNNESSNYSKSSTSTESECYNLEYLNDKDMTAIINWVLLVRQMCHKNLVVINQVTIENSCLNIHYFSPKYGCLADIILVDNNLSKHGISNESLIASIIYQICQGLLYLHCNMNVIHRGVCIHSIFVDCKGMVKLGKLDNCIEVMCKNNPIPLSTKLTDFPINKFSVENINLIPWYSPELIEQEYYGYSFNSDVYSVGLVLACIFTARLPYQDCEPGLIMLKKLCIVDLPTLDVINDRPEASKVMQDFYKLCIIHNPRERPNVETILNHSWLNVRTHCSKSSWKKIIND